MALAAAARYPDDDVSAPGAAPLVLPLGVTLRPLVARPDERGSLTEIFRAEWSIGVEPLQWNLVDNVARVQRGVHVHVHHVDYLTVLAGRATIAVRDLRRHSPTSGLVALIPMSGDDRAGLVIPPGVAHGFYFPVVSTHLYGVDCYWSPADEMGCHWLDPDLEIPWPDREALVSERDVSAISLAELLDDLEPHQDALYAPS